jgi:DNA-binding NtrC family response regulator
VTAVLVVDDDEGTRTAVSQMLRFRGYTAVGVEHGQRAIELLRERPIVLVIVDLMRRREALQTIGRIRELYPAIPIIAISAGSAAFSPLLDARLKSADWLIERPLSLKRLLRAVDELLDCATRARDHKG